jgi:hypothetical protein
MKPKAPPPKWRVHYADQIYIDVEAYSRADAKRKAKRARELLHPWKKVPHCWGAERIET